VLLVILSAVTLVVAVTALIRTTRSFFRIDFRVTWVEGGLTVDQVPLGSSAQAAGLSEGDLIVAIDGTSVSRLEDPKFLLAAGEEHRLVVHSPAGEEDDFILHPPPPQVDAVYLARSLVGFIGLLCAIWAVLTTQRREAATFLLLAVAALVLGAMPHKTAATGLSLQVLHRMASVAVPLLTVRFFAIFPERKHSMRLWDVATVIMVASAVLMALYPNLEAWWPATRSVLRAVFATGLFGGLVLHAIRWRTAIRVARIRRQIEWAALGLFVGLLPFAALVALPRWLGFPFEPFSWLAVLPITAFPLGVLAGLTEYRMWDLELISREAISAVVVVTAGGLLFAVTNHLLLRHATSGPGSLRNLLAFATGMLLVVLLQPVRLGVQRSLDRWLYHGRPTPRWLLTHATRDLARATDPRELLTGLSETLHDGLEFDLVATYLRAGDGHFERITGERDELPDRLGRNILDHRFPHPAEKTAHAAGYALRIPLERLSTVHGLLYVGLRRGIFPLGTEGREVLMAFAAQAALGLESARLLDDLRRQAEEYRILHANTQRIIESSAAGILVCDAAGRILSANIRAAGVLGEESQAMVGVDLSSFISLPENWRPQLPLHAVNAEAATHGEQPRRVVMAVSVLELDSGSFNGRVVVLQDVTELRDLQDRLREQEWLAALGRLASGLAHEINTPLTGIASFAQMLGEMTPSDDPRAGLISKLVDQSFRVARIVANLHEAVRGSKADRVMLDLGEAAERAAIDALRSLGAADQIVIERSPSPVMVWGAQGPVELAVSNLVRNAVEASPPNVKVRMIIASSSSWGEVEVHDQGSGFPESLKEKVFEPFFTTKTKRGGTGLGLAITRDMITQLGGEVELDCPPEGGARAIIRLPLWQPKQAS
jgi:signal transduction histidine kinase